MGTKTDALNAMKCPRCGASTTCASCRQPMPGCIESGLIRLDDLSPAQISSGEGCVTIYRHEQCATA